MQVTGVAGVPTGKLELPAVTRLRLATRRPPVDTTPQKATSAWLGFAADLIAHVAEQDLPLTPRTLPVLIEDAVQALSRGWFAEGLTRRGLALGHAAAMTYLGRCQVPVMRPATPALGRLAATVRSPQLRRLAVAAAVPGPRLGLTTADGPTGGLLLDRLHYTHLAGLVDCDWMARQVEADLRLGHAVAGAAFHGVRVVCPQAFASSVHVAADRTRHPFGGCRHCTPTGAFA